MISFIMCLRNRMEQAVHTLPTVFSQAAACNGEVIVVDQDSEPGESAQCLLMCRSLGGDYVRLDRGGPFSRSWTLNVGAWRAKQPILAFCDADVVLGESYASVVISTFSEVFRGGSCVINCFPEAVDEQNSASFKETGDMDVLRGEPWWTLGAGSNTDRATFLKLGGFDEAYDGWGCEDDDLFLRFRAAGAGWACIAPSARCWHLWHAPAPKKDNDEPPNRERLARSVERIAAGDLVRNTGREWGNTAWVPVG